MSGEVSSLATVSCLATVYNMASTSNLLDLILNEPVNHATSQRVSSAFLDTMGVMILAQGSDHGEALSTYGEMRGSPGPCRMPGTTDALSLETATFVGGTLAHALEFDDIGLPMWGHPSAVMVPGLLALSQVRPISGATAIRAYVAGYQVACSAAERTASEQYTRGFHTTSTVGTLAAATASGVALGLETEQLGFALGIAASLSGGLRSNFGTLTKAVHAGAAARNGVTAVLLAASGITSNPDAFGAFAGHDSWEFSRARSLLPEDPLRGLVIKLYPSCGSSHRVIDGAIDLFETHEFLLEDIERVTLRVSERSLLPLLSSFPANAHEAKFSLEFCCAVALTCGWVGLDDFSEARLADNRLASLMNRIEVEVDDGQAQVDMETEFASISVSLRSGQTVSTRVNHPLGYPENPMPRSLLERKFVGCVEGRLGRTQQRQILARTHQLGELDELSELVRLSMSR